ncbi:MAG: pyridoxal phosphate-dependent aminotransferase [Candidatus Syntropharchaeia archaeon]
MNGVRFSSRAEDIDISGIRKIFEAASSDAINLGLGQPDFDTPPHIKEAAMDAIKEGFTGYTHGKGIQELREALSMKFKEQNNFSVFPDEIIVTSGASEGLHIAVESLVDEGDEVLVPDPGFVSYSTLTRIAGGKAVGVPLDEEMKISPEVVKEIINRKTKALIVNSPSNPTGSVQTRDEIRALAEIADDYGITIISDEVYEHFVYEGEHVSPAEFGDNVITVNAVSKTYAMTGWRLGYVAAREEYIEQMLKIHQYVQACASSISQRAALAAITGPQECVEKMKREFEIRRDIVVDGLKRMGMEFPPPKGAFYIFPKVKDEMEFVKRLLEKKVIVTPGSSFGERGKGHIRISYATSRDNLKKALEIIEGELK